MTLTGDQRAALAQAVRSWNWRLVRAACEGRIISIPSELRRAFPALAERARLPAGIREELQRCYEAHVARYVEAVGKDRSTRDRRAEFIAQHPRPDWSPCEVDDPEGDLEVVRVASLPRRELNAYVTRLRRDLSRWGWRCAETPEGFQWVPCVAGASEPINEPVPRYPRQVIAWLRKLGETTRQEGQVIPLGRPRPVMEPALVGSGRELGEAISP